MWWDRLGVTMGSGRGEVFISYSRSDEKYRERLAVHLKSLEDEGVTTWSDVRNEPGDQWLANIEGALQRCAIAIFLVSADLVASDFIKKKELPPLIERAAAGGVRLLVIGASPATKSNVLASF